MKIYTAEPQVADFRQVFGAMARGVAQSRYLAYRLFIKEIKADYARAHCGILWDFLEPLVLAVVFIILMQSRVISGAGIEIPPSVFIIYGVLLWMTFSDAILFPMQVIRRSRHMITNSQVAAEALIISVFLRIAFNSLFRIVIMLGIAVTVEAVTGVECFSAVGFLKFLLLFPSLILAGMAFGVLLTPFNTIYNDISRFVSIMLRPLMYASPVLYAVPPHPILEFVNRINPVSTLLVNLRSLATRDHFSAGGMGLTCLALAVVFMVGWFIFHVSLPVVAERA